MKTFAAPVIPAHYHVIPAHYHVIPAHAGTQRASVPSPSMGEAREKVNRADKGPGFPRSQGNVRGLPRTTIRGTRGADIEIVGTKPARRDAENTL